LAISDNFDGAVLNPVWTVVDPRGDCTVGLTGSGKLSLAVPAGISHDIWTGEKNAVRVMQDMTNVDLVVEVKFDTNPTGSYAINGLLVDQDALTFVRFDVYSIGAASNFIFAATFTGGLPTVKLNTAIPKVAPRYLRVSRVVNTWTLEYSTDGVIWTLGGSFSFGLVVSAVGIFAGNASTLPALPPAYTSLADFFHITPEDPIFSSGYQNLLKCKRSCGSSVGPTLKGVKDEQCILGEQQGVSEDAIWQQDLRRHTGPQLSPTPTA